MKIRLVFQIIFCILAVLSVVSVVFLGIFLGWTYALIGVGAAILFGILMLWVKGSGPHVPDPEEPSDPDGPGQNDEQ